MYFFQCLFRFAQVSKKVSCLFVCLFLPLLLLLLSYLYFVYFRLFFFCTLRCSFRFCKCILSIVRKSMMMTTIELNKNKQTKQQHKQHNMHNKNDFFSLLLFSLLFSVFTLLFFLFRLGKRRLEICGDGIGSSFFMDIYFGCVGRYRWYYITSTNIIR